MENQHKVSLSHSSLNFFVYLYNIKKNIKKDLDLPYQKSDVIGEETLTIDSIKLHEIIANILKIYPALEIGEVLEELKKYYYGVEVNNINNKKFTNYISYSLNETELSEIKNILNSLDIEYIDRTEELKKLNLGNLFAINFNELPETEEFYKMIYKSLIVYTLFYFAKIPVIKEKVIYNDGKKESIFYSTYFNEKTIDFFIDKFELENWEVNTILNKHLKVKNIKYLKNSVNLIKILYNIDYYNSIGINLFNIDYYIKKLQENGLIKSVNNEIIFTKKSVNLYETLSKLDLLDILNHSFNEKLYEELISEINNSDKEILDILNIYLDKINLFLELNNLPSKKQIEALKTLRNDNLDLNIPKEAFTNKILASEIISNNIKEKTPTDKQIELAKDISKKLKIKIDKDTMSSHSKLSQWIFENKKKIKRKPSKKMVELALKLAKDFNIKVDDDILEDFTKTQNFIKKIV